MADVNELERMACEAPSRIPVEVWRGERKVTVYAGETVLRIWGPNIDTEMSDEPFSLAAVQSAMDWLYTDGASTPLVPGKAGR